MTGHQDRATPTTPTAGGVGFVGLLTVAFVVLKLVGVIDWSWWWVVSPVWIATLLVVALLVALGVIALLLERAKRR